MATKINPKKASKTVAVDKPKRTPTDWPYNRRARLFNDLQNAFYKDRHSGKHEDYTTQLRSFLKEAGKRLPRLAREIERHNSVVRKADHKRQEAKQKEINQAKHDAYYGSEDQCQALADKYLPPR